MLASRNPRAEETTKLLLPQYFGFHRFYPHRDWGNAELLEIARRTAAIPEIAWLTTANGFFRCILRRQPAPDAPMFWALEWNKSVRLAGWIGAPEATPPIFTDLPDPGWQVVPQADGSTMRYRLETPLGEAEDLLFAHEDDPADSDPATAV